ncbi:isocitrate lyase/PEP mutase family protein [Qaidamihabitans albus]|uniref:isocitrate lyase/PEP mutase family protein n=1 Tax=Qaidamihabitans albus TaxID=2795733 RepID=UPI0018F11466|nr:isocitrate lyase/PEP mutase family protein [Qaidamihabitans albus]
MSAAAELRRLLAAPGMLRAPGVFDGISAHVARRAGCQAVYLTGAGAAASGFGLPDIGLVTQTEMADRARHVVEAAEVPVIADADTGYGAPVNVVRTVREYERAGVAAIQLEDQAFPKRCGHLPDKEIVTTDDYLRTLHAALDARRAGTLIIARTDARGPAGLDEALARAHRYAAEGADMIFVEAPRSREEIERIAEVRASLLFNVAPGGLTPPIPDKELEHLGFAAAIYPGALLMPAATAMLKAIADLTGQRSETIDSPAALLGIVGMDAWTTVGERFQDAAQDP